VRELLADKAVCGVSDPFFVQDGVPYLALVARYRSPVAPPPAPAAE
jgi:hypothetical protein